MKSCLIGFWRRKIKFLISSPLNLTQKMTKIDVVCVPTALTIGAALNYVNAKI